MYRGSTRERDPANGSPDRPRDCVPWRHPAGDPANGSRDRPRDCVPWLNPSRRPATGGHGAGENRAGHSTPSPRSGKRENSTQVCVPWRHPSRRPATGGHGTGENRGGHRTPLPGRGNAKTRPRSVYRGSTRIDDRLRAPRCRRESSRSPYSFTPVGETRELTHPAARQYRGVGRARCPATLRACNSPDRGTQRQGPPTSTAESDEHLVQQLSVPATHQTAVHKARAARLTSAPHPPRRTAVHKKIGRSPARAPHLVTRPPHHPSPTLTPVDLLK